MRILSFRLALLGLATAFLVSCDGSSTSPAGLDLAVDVGADRSVASGATVALSATVSNGVGDLTYSWTQVSGDTVTLADPSLAGASFVAPLVPRDTPATLVFALSVQDESGRVASDTVTLTVALPDRAVFLAARRNVSVNELMIYDLAADEAKVLSGETTRTRDVASWRWSPDESTLAFITRDGSVVDVFVVKPDGTGLVKVVTGTEAEIRWLPDSSRLVVQADGETTGVTEVFTCLPDGTGVTKVSGAVVSGGDVNSIYVAGDSSRVVFQGDLETDGVIELFSADPAGTGRIKLSRTLVANGDVDSVDLPEEASVLVYSADAETDGVLELYGVGVDGSNPVKLSGVMVSGGSLLSFQRSPAGTHVAYLADQDIDGATELYVVQVDGTERLRLTAASSSANDVSQFAWSPDGSRLAYTGDMDVDGDSELFAVGPDGSGSVKMNGTLATGADVTEFFWAPDSSGLVYRADEESLGVLELFVVMADGTGRVKVSGTMISGGDVTSNSVRWAPDSSRLVYRADQETNGLIELFTTTSAGSPTKVNDLLSGSISTYQWAPDSSTIAYIASERSNQRELFATDADGSNHRILSPTRGTVIADTIEFRWSPDSGTVAFIGNHQTYFAQDFFTVSSDGSDLKAHTDVPYSGIASTIRWAPDDSN